MLRAFTRREFAEKHQLKARPCFGSGHWRVIMEQLVNASSNSTAVAPDAAGSTPESPLRVASLVRKDATYEDAGASRVRRFEPRDLGQVADLFIERFRPGARGKQAAVARCISETYLARPESPGEAHSLVHVEVDGAVTGFVGMQPAAMRMNGRSLKVGVLGAFMVARPEQNPAIAVRLGRAVRASNLDLVTSDTTNPRSLSFCRALRIELLPTHGLEWVKALRPAETLAALLARRVGGNALLSGLARLVEPLARRVYDPSLTEPTSLATTTRLLDLDGFLERAEILTGEWPLRPDWRSGAMRRLIGLAALKVRNGPMRLCEVVESNGRLAGVYILYTARGKIAHAPQIVARPNREREVVVSLLRLADDEGAAAVRGVVDQNVLTGLAGVPRVFYHQGAAAIAFSRDAEIRAALREGKALIGGLIGERWSRLVADPFD
jgi:hypothetical protein